MRIEREMLADLSTKPKRLAVGRQQKFDRSRIETNSVIERLNLVLLVDATNDHHSGENLKLGDVTGVTGEERLDCKRSIGFDHDVHPGRRNIDPWKPVDDPG